MRITTAYQYDSITARIDATSQALQNATDQISSGKKFTTLSQDPYAAVKSLNIRSIQNSLTQYTTNINSAKVVLSSGSNALSSMNSLLQQANSVAIAASNTTVDATARTNYATQIKQLQDQLISLGNTKDASGQYVFAGQKSDTAPFTATNGVATYNGDSKDVPIEVGPGATINSNISAGDLITQTYSQLESLRNHLTSNDALSLASDVGVMQKAADSVQQVEGDVGYRLKQITQLTSDNTRRQTELTSSLSDNENIDFAAAVVKLQQAQTAYQAVLSSSSISMKLSLMDYMPTG